MPSHPFRTWRKDGVRRVDRGDAATLSDCRIPPYLVHAQHAIKPMAAGRTWIVEKFGLPDWWAKLAAGKPRKVKVAILDTGIDPFHRDHGECAGIVRAAEDFTGRAPGGVDGHGHGSSCASICAGNDDGQQMAGAAAGFVDLYCGKVLDDSGSGNFNAIRAGMRWAIDQGVDVISMSFGSPQPDPAMTQMIAEAAQKGIYVVAAAGNDGSKGTNFPGADPNAFCVGAIDENLNIAPFSSRGAAVDLVGAGVQILSAWKGGQYVTISGTSMATPWVAGMCALRRAFELAAGKQPLGGLAILNTLPNYCDDLGEKGDDPAYGWGVPDPKLLFDMGAVSPPPPPPPPPPPNLPPIVKLRGTNLVIDTSQLEPFNASQIPV